MNYLKPHSGLLPGGIFSRLIPAIAAGGMLGSYIWNKWNRKGSKNMGNQQSAGQHKSGQFPIGEIRNQEPGNISLKSVSINGYVDGLLFKATISQEYHNNTDGPLEIIYTFPVAWDTALLGMKAKIGERELIGRIVEKTEAEEQYEEALEKGDSAIMVQKSAKGLFTANLGNIKAGESVTVEIQCAKLVNLDDGKIRICVPTVIGLRYGDEHMPGALGRHETAMPSRQADYNFHLRITIAGDITPLNITCPTHVVEMAQEKEGLVLRLGAGAKLDRDFVLLIDAGNGESIAEYTKDGENYLEMAAFCPALPAEALSPIGLKILVDCSGSMSGERIGQARTGLAQVARELNNRDYVSFSRFGTNVKHSTHKLVPCSREIMERLEKNIDGTTADMGGTNMEDALVSTFRDIKQPAGAELPPAVLLITDGDVWNTENIIAAAQKSGHRIFAIGVGSAPAESLLMEMAEQTGGACEFVTPGENMAGAIVRVFRKMRTAIATDVKIEWHGAPLWQSGTPRFIYGGETARCFALMPGRPQTPPVLKWKINGSEYSASAAAVTECHDFDLARLGAQCRVNQSANNQEKLALALKYQLVSDVTSMILVYEREQGDKVAETAKIQQVPQMWASGHGCANIPQGAGALMSSLTGKSCFSSLGFAAKSFTGRIMCDCCVDPGIFISLEDDASPRPTGRDEKLALLASIIDTWHVNLFAQGDIASRMAGAGNDDSLKPVTALIAAAAGHAAGVSLNSVWAAFIEWAYKILAAMNSQANGGRFEIDRHSRRMIKEAVKNVAPNDLDELRKAFNAWLEQDRYPA